MSFRSGILLLLFFVFALACKKTDQFPEKKSEKVAQTSVENWNVREVESSAADSADLREFTPELKEMYFYIKMYDDRNPDFNTLSAENRWQDYLPKLISTKYSENDYRLWLESTGFLLELTGNPKYAAELERLSQIEVFTKNLEKGLAPFVFTKYVDHIFVNLFPSAQVSYQHSFFGNITLTQESSYPQSGSIRLHFNVEGRKYIELNIRIPEWAEGATVTVKKVKYVATPGTYCKIAKKWKEGDEVEIELPADKITY